MERVALEEQVQEARQKAVGDQVMVRLREGELETVNREGKTLRGLLENMQLNMAAIMRENDQLKQTLNEHERSSI